MPERTISETVLQVATFRLNGRLFGVDIRDVKEVNAEAKISKIYHAEPHVRGYMNIRGQIHLVVDLRVEFGFDPCVIDSMSRVVIFKSSIDEPFGVLVDKVEDILELDIQKIVDRKENDISTEESQGKKAGRQGLCIGVYPLKTELLLLLDAKAIL